jgi:hypothetical protein
MPRLWANWLTLLGAVIASVAGVAVGVFVLVDLIAPGKNGYAGTLVIVALPLMFVFGLLLIPVGLWMDRRHRPALPSPVEAAFQAALHDRGARNRIVFVAVVTLVNVGLVGYGAQSSMRYMDSPKFCGGTCHPVMQRVPPLAACPRRLRGVPHRLVVVPQGQAQRRRADVEGDDAQLSHAGDHARREAAVEPADLRALPLAALFRQSLEAVSALQGRRAQLARVQRLHAARRRAEPAHRQIRRRALARQSGARDPISISRREA